VARSLPFAIGFLAMLAGVSAASAQPTDSTRATAIAQVTIGQSVAPLYGPWKFHVGDSPLDPATHASLWAEPGFDDSKWETVTLAPPGSAVGASNGITEDVPGWTARGHARYWGYAWYRIAIHLERRPSEKLALAGPSDVDDAYQVFWNGMPIGSFGDFAASWPITYYNQPMMFEVPQDESVSSASPTVLAFRVWMEPNTLVTSVDAGGFRSAPLVGSADMVSAVYHLRRVGVLRKYTSFVVDAFLYGLLALVAFSLILFDRSDRVYLWMGAVFLITATYSGLGAFDIWTQHISILEDLLITQCFLGPLAYAGWAMVWWVWFGQQPPTWLPRAIASLAVTYMISNAIALEIFFFIPHPVAAVFEVVALIVRLLFFVLLLWIVIQGIRRQGLEGWLVLPAIVLLGIGLSQSELAFLHVRLNWFPLGIWVTLALIANLLLVATLALLLLRRLLLSVRRQRLIEIDARRAQLQSDFVAAVSHEFRSPLTTLRTITDLLVGNRIPDEARRQQSYVFLDRETTRLQRLVEDLLDFQLMESSRKQYRIETLDAFQLVRSTVAEFRELAVENGFEVEQDLSQTSALVHADEEAFRRALRNLLDNAMKYSPVCRTVWVNGAVVGSQVLISVRDQGMGIDLTEQSAIFQKFVRGDAAKKTSIRGTGIGLAMVQQISQALGGEIRLRSEVSVGSTFTLVLPLAHD